MLSNLNFVLNVHRHACFALFISLISPNILKSEKKRGINEERANVEGLRGSTIFPATLIENFKHCDFQVVLARSSGKGVLDSGQNFRKWRRWNEGKWTLLIKHKMKEFDLLLYWDWILILILGWPHEERWVFNVVFGYALFYNREIPRKTFSCGQALWGI